METVFWIAFIGAIYSYFLYPLVLVLTPGRQPTQPHPSTGMPKLTLVVTVYNEAERVRAKLDNCLGLRYPSDRLEILIASDASDDGTDAIVKEYAERGVRLVRADRRLGKEHAQRLAIQEAEGEILVFSDAATRIPHDSLLRIVEGFSDPSVGAISSEDRFVAPDGRVVGEGAYVRYEMWLRRLESDVHSLVGLSGSFFAARRRVCQEWDIHSPSDFNTALNCARLGYVAVSDPDLNGFYPAIQEEKREYQRKLRTVIRGITSLVRQPAVLNPFQYGFFSFQVWSHKVMRWLVPWFLLALLLASFALATQSWFYATALAGQLVFYALVITGMLCNPLRARTFVKIPYFFVQVNVAIAHATLAFLLGKRVTTWQPSKR
ncbi:glycosyl transferase [Alkalilimnicola ehrlichii]|uniref:Glycosyl transferase n=1 Tax=Alkalilimnicola ehrlichii TaxID=351052 RepID=A0A3E0WIX5_9GAMM|nr:glycosyltransferase family 2 protein [Alkalilimnicola ehrlichii]RFA25147.1 glycosyl transferase [Alkalilimnicola ehrlichii]RFA32101.1 glycosyl transferase [Alkalilimnicola ehrlichii]